MSAKLTERLWRYLRLEIISIIMALIAAFGAARFTGSGVAGL